MANAATKTRMLENTGISPSRLKMALTHSINRKRPVFVWGPPGIGKSDIVAEVAREQNRPLIDIRLPLMEPTGLFGRRPDAPSGPYGDGTLLGYVWTPAAAAAVLLSAVLGLAVSLSTFLVIGATSSLTYNVVVRN